MNIRVFEYKPYEVPFFEALETEHMLTMTDVRLNETTVSLANGYDAVLVRGYSTLSAPVIEKLASYNIHFISTRTAALSHIDLNACKEHDIHVAYVPSYAPYAIAELAVMHGITLLRQFSDFTSHAAQHQFSLGNKPITREVKHSTIGIIGTGHIGLETAKRYAAFGAQILFYSNKHNEEALQYGIYTDLETLLQTSDIISLHIPLTPETHHFINEERFKHMKASAILVNTGRGALVDEAALLQALRKEELYGYGADVLTQELSFFDKQIGDVGYEIDDQTKKLLDLYPRVVITPHIGANTIHATKEMVVQGIENFTLMEQGQVHPHIVL